MSYTLNYDEPIPEVVERLKMEHKEIQTRLSDIYEASEKGDLKSAINSLKEATHMILRHEVEEEARLMRVIMWEVPARSERSISIMREHRNIANFLKYTLFKLTDLPEKVARREIRIFVIDLKKHHAEEEKVVFPLALKADLASKKRMQKIQ